MEAQQPDHEQLIRFVDSVSNKMSKSLASSMVDGLQQSELFTKLLETIESMRERITYLESKLGDNSLVERIEELETKLQALTQNQSKPPSQPPPPRPSMDPVLPPANRPQNLGVSNMPFGLSAEPIKRTAVRRNRSRTPVRPTVVYRTDPRATGPTGPAGPTGPLGGPLGPLSPAKQPGPSLPPEPNLAQTDEEPLVCTEPGCDRPVRCRGLCSLHYQRLRYKERKIETKQANDNPLPPPPPPKRPMVSMGKKKEGTRGIFALLYDEKGKRTLAGLINQIKFNRSDLVERLNKQFAGMPGVPLEEEDVIRVVHYHKLTDMLSMKEGEIITRHLTKQRGSIIKTSQKLKIPPERFQRRVEDLGIQKEVERIRDEFREEIISSAFSKRLDLALTREKYLKDLDIETEVDQSLRDEIQEQIAKLEHDGEQAAETIRLGLDLDEQRLRRMIRRYHLEEQLNLPQEEGAEGAN